MYLVHVYLIFLKKGWQSVQNNIYYWRREKKIILPCVEEKGWGRSDKKKEEKERVLSHQHATHGFQNIYSSVIASIVWNSKTSPRWFQKAMFKNHLLNNITQTTLNKNAWNLLFKSINQTSSSVSVTPH